MSEALAADLALQDRTVELFHLPPTSALEAEVKARGTCVDHPHKEWWTVTRIMGSEEQTMQTMAKHECLRCPVRAKCQDLADYLESTVNGRGLDYAYLAGIWGGEGPKQRADRRNTAKVQVGIGKAVQ